MTKHSVRIGVIGAGYWGPKLIRNCAELGVLDSICDIDEAALEAAHRLYPSVTVTTMLSDFLSRPMDAVIISAPANLHAEIALEAIAAGKHVFVEKPLALSVTEGNQVERAASKAGLIVFVGHLVLYHPAVKKIRSMIAEGVIGDIWHVRSRRLSLGKLRTHENVWWSFAPHDVALMIAIFGEEPLGATSAHTHGRGTSNSDVAYADFEFSRGRSAHIEVSWLDPDKSARLDVFGRYGVLTLEESRREARLTLKPFTISTDEYDKPIVMPGQEQRINIDSREPLQIELGAFIDWIASGKPAETDARQGVAVLRALAMADEKASQQVVQEVTT